MSTELTSCRQYPMDVPSWHPANQASDALRRLAMDGGDRPKRTEFKDVDTLTKSEREMVVTDANAVQDGERGLLDPSDRLYLVEQTLLEQEATDREQRERENALQAFRSKALEVQARKTSVPELVGLQKPLVSPKMIKPVVVVVPKAKKRTLKTAEKNVGTKKRKTSRIGTCVGLKVKAKAARDDRESDVATDRQREIEHDALRVLGDSSTIAKLVDDYSSDD
uniref:Uncharacterized protein n=1 Tax=Peronospora matthiolae TaxID=2874970 RepID=A0AAV1TKS0_9STRA